MDNGRPTKYKPEYDKAAYKACKIFGADDKKLAELFEVTETTINNWKNDHLSFFESLKKGKDEFDTKNVEVSLLQRACGYVHDEIKYFAHEGVVTDERKVTRHYPPDTIAAIFWLKNRNPDRWKDIKAVEHSGPDKKPISIEILKDLGKLSNSELEELIEGDAP